VVAETASGGECKLLLVGDEDSKMEFDSCKESNEYYRDFFRGRRLDPSRLRSYRGTSLYNDAERYAVVFALIDDLCLPGDARVLDLGAGGGIISQFLSSRFESVYACDLTVTPDMRETGRTAQSILFVQAALPKLAFPEQAFDLVVFSEVIEHLLKCDQQPAISEIARILKANSWCVLSTPNPVGLHSMLLRFVHFARGMTGESKGLGSQPVENWKVPRHLTSMLEDHFRIVRRAGSYYLPPLVSRLPSVLTAVLYDLSDHFRTVHAFRNLGLYQYYVLHKST
jgi:2-polyprenyl-3-methyl-5-hydroxy-6-metoxy-1,4-benzoquinol methylase